MPLVDLLVVLPAWYAEIRRSASHVANAKTALAQSCSAHRSGKSLRFANHCPKNGHTAMQAVSRQQIRRAISV
jgi:hypothetical protein